MLRVSIQREDSMTTVSWKDIVESSTTYMNEYGMPEDLYTDPAESTPDDPR